MRILAVGNMYPPHHAGGYEIAWQQAMVHARAAGHEVRILTTDYRSGGERPEEDPDVHRQLRWYWDLETYTFPAYSLPELWRLERGNHAVLRSHLRAFRPDVLTWWSMGCMSLSLIEQGRRCGIPAVLLVHDDWLVYGPQRDGWLHAWEGPRRGRVAPWAERLTGIPTRVALKTAGHYVFNSAYTRERALGLGLVESEATVVHPGIGDAFLDAVAPREWGWRMAYVGRLDRQKGVDTAIAALAELPVAATLSIWGTGEEAYIAEMRAEADRLGVADRVRFEGFAGAGQLRDVYGAADVVVFPVRWNEPFGLVPLEAMGLGRPVVTTARGGTSEFVRDGENALVFEADDPPALAGSVTRLAQDPALRHRLLDGGRATAARFTAARFAQETVAEIVAGAAR